MSRLRGTPPPPLPLTFRGRPRAAESRPARRPIPNPLDRLKGVLRSKWMPLGAAGLGFLEASFIVFPIEPLAIPAMAARRQNAWVIAGFLLLGSVLGACLMYALGALAAEPVIEPLFERLGMTEGYEQASAELRERGAAALLLVGVTPFPIQAGAAAAGAIGYSFFAFIAVIALARGVRFAVLAGLVALLGARAGDLIERHETTLMIGGIALFVVIAAWMIVSP